MAHAPFPPSGADIWMNCHAAFALQLQMPEPPESSYAAEGSRLHDIGAEYLMHVAAGTLAPQRAAEDMKFLKPYLDYCENLMRRTTTSGWLIERKLHHSPLLSGTADFMCWGDGVVDVVDLKTGAGVAVEPEENKQLMTYGGMALLIPEGIKRVRLTIVQPPADTPVKTWETTPERIEQHMRDAEAAIAMSLTPAQVPVPGDHCRWCKAKPICPTLRGYVAEADRMQMPASLQPDVIGLWLDRATQVEGFINDLRVFAHQYATKALEQQRPGIPGYVLKPKRAMRAWADPDSTLEWARKNRQVTAMTERVLLSPAQVEKKDKALYAKVADHVVAVSSGTNLVKGATEALGVAPAQPSLAASLALLKHRV